MNSYILPLNKQHRTQVFHFLQSQDPWHIIPLDALLLYNMNHPNHHWFAEIRDGKIRGVIFRDRGLLHFAYPQAPEPASPLYLFIKNNYSTFITHGKKEILEPLITHLLERSSPPYEESVFVKQSVQTERLALKKLEIPTQVAIRLAQPMDMREISVLFHGSSVERELDSDLVTELIHLQRVLVAEKQGKLVGTIMRLKESSAYSLLGGLFVASEVCHQGIARLLGQYMIINALQRRKNVCFYYKENQELSDFYHQGQFIPMGKWRTYSV